MKTNVLVYSKSVIKGEFLLNLSTLFSICNKTGFELENFVMKEKYDFALTESLITDPLIVLCEKKDMEVFEINLSYKFSSDREIVFEDCVRLTSGMNVIFIPLESDYYKKIFDFLVLANTEEKVSMFRLFGKSLRYVNKMLAENDIDVSKIKVVEDNLLCDIFISVPKEQLGLSEIERQVGSLFNENIYSDNEMDLKDVVVNLLKMHKLKLDIVEPFTAGAITKQFFDDGEVLYESLVPFEERALANEGKMSGVDFKQYGNCSVETNTMLCKSRLSENGANLIVVLTGQKTEDGYLEIVSFADGKNVNSIKTVFKGDKKQAVDFSVNWVLFNLVKKLRKKDFENM